MSYSKEPPAPKPYKLVSLPSNPPTKQAPIGHHVFKADKLTGSISLELTVETIAFVASGVVAMESDVIKLPNSSKNKLLKVALSKDDKLIIPGSSLKGVVRSIYEAITNSCLCKTNSDKISTSYKECKDKTKLCPACRVFGAMDWQGLISFNDSFATQVKPTTGFMRSLYGPRSQCKLYRSPGRKFYYHARPANNNGTRGLSAQIAAKGLILTTNLQFMNLAPAELGALLIVLGQDKSNPFSLKIGGGKPIGMGSMTVKVTKIDHPASLRDRYSSYDAAENDLYTNDRLTQEIERLITIAHGAKLIQQPQLNQLKEVLNYPTNRIAPSGMY